MENTKIALGAWAWGEGITKDSVFGNDTTLDTLRPVYDYAMEHGLNFWDTALVYGMGASEKILGEFFKTTKREDYIVSTKFTPQIAGMFNNSMQDMLDASKANLNTDVIDIYWIHNPVDIKVWAKEIIPLAISGQIKRIGVSNHNLEELKYVESVLRPAGLKVSAIQNHFSLLNRTSETGGLLKYCNDNNIDFFSYMVLEQGALSGNYDEEHPFKEGSDRAKSYNPILKSLKPLILKMKEIGLAHDANVAQIAISWAIHKNTIPIVGVTKVKHVEDALKTVEIKLSREEIEEIESKANEIDVDVIRGWEKSMD